MNTTTPSISPLDQAEIDFRKHLEKLLYSDSLKNPYHLTFLAWEKACQVFRNAANEGVSLLDEIEKQRQEGIKILESLNKQHP